MSFCKKMKIYCLDANHDLNLSKQDTYDLIHLSPSGSRKLSEFLFNSQKNYINPN